VRAASLRRLHLLEQEDAGPLADHEARARRVERARRARRVLILGGEAAHVREAREDERVDARLRPAGEDDVGGAVPDELGALADRVRPGRACRDDRVVRAPHAELDRDLPARRVDQDVLDEAR
jgi:hypothetical protein